MSLTKSPPAFVREWNASEALVQCPFCSKTHTHGITSLRGIQVGSQPAFDQERRQHSLCDGISEYYHICFPYEPAAQAEGYVWMIDRENSRYVTIGLPPEVNTDYSMIDESDLNGVRISSVVVGSRDPVGEGGNKSASMDELAEHLTAVKLSADSSRTRDEIVRRCNSNTYPPLRFGEDVENALSKLRSMCSANKAEEVKAMLSHYSDENLLSTSHGTSNEVVLAVAVKGFAEVLEVLLEAGADASAKDKRGRTPLMEAALWARETTFNLLLANGVNAEARDDRARSALDFLEESELNSRERDARSSFFEDSRQNRKARCRMRASLLVHNAALSVQQPIQLSCTPQLGHFRDYGLTKSWYVEVARYQVNNKDKTVGRLVLSQNKLVPVVAAVSGWKKGVWPQTSFVIDSEIYTRRVKELCQKIGYTLLKDDRDGKEFAGAFDACHAEKQLATYFIDQYVVWEAGWKSNQGLGSLRGVAPCRLGAKVPSATIVVSNPPRGLCSSCTAFIGCINERYRVELEVEVSL